MKFDRRDDFKPRLRSPLRLALGKSAYSLLRYASWAIHSRSFACEYGDSNLPFSCFSHSTPLLRQLKDVDMQYQHNKIVNLRIAAQKLDGILLRPRQSFSFWRIIGRPSVRKGYLDGMVLQGGKVAAGIGGGLCQMSNLLYWMTLHTPLTVRERHRHGYDVFPDSERTQPFGSGATCSYPYLDLIVRNDTDATFQLRINVAADTLEGEWRSDRKPFYHYRIIEKNHVIKGEWWGGFSRNNELYRQCFDKSEVLLSEEFVTQNHAMMIYVPLIAYPKDDQSD